jgi:predicted TIM-barrel fold metal-dependent hydrolase
MTEQDKEPNTNREVAEQRQPAPDEQNRGQFIRGGRLGVLDRHGVTHGVLTAPSFYGTDNRCMLDALGAAGRQARGVAMVTEDCADAELQAMHERGVRALRLDLFLRSNWPTADIIRYIEASVRRAVRGEARGTSRVLRWRM